MICPNCGSHDLSIFYTIEGVPIHSVLLLKTREEAINYPAGDIALTFCSTCGFIFNAVVDTRLHEYSENYESTQGYSPTFNRFAQDLANRLIERYDLHGKRILEIGCGQGEFISLLCDLGDNTGIGFDPAYDRERSPVYANQRVTFISDYYSEKYSKYKADFICCKMTLEHIQFTRDFIHTIRLSISNRLDTTVFFQVPDVTRILRECAFWDIYYEHCSYFSPVSLTHLFRDRGFTILNLRRDYDEQYLLIETKPASEMEENLIDTENNLEALTKDVDTFKRQHQHATGNWKLYLRELTSRGQRTILWGAGSKAVAFLTTLHIRDEIEYCVDINPYKQGSFMPGSGQRIVSPQFLKNYRPDVVIVMNPIYLNEIGIALASLDIELELVPVCKLPV